MSAVRPLKPAGGIAAVAVVPAGAAAVGSPEEIAAAAVAVPLVEGRSSYDETVMSDNGIIRVEHRLTIAVPPDYAHEFFGEDIMRQWASAGTAAVVVTEAGERLVVGWSERFGSEQPLRLAGIGASTGTTPHETPAVVLTFRSVDTAPATRIQN